MVEEPPPYLCSVYNSTFSLLPENSVCQNLDQPVHVSTDPNSESMADQQTFDREIDALGPVFDFLGEFLAREELGDSVEFALNFVVEELFTNMVKYNTGTGDRISIEVAMQDSVIWLQLTDHDVDPFDPSGLDDVDTQKSIDDRVPGGLGIHLVKSMVDTITYSYDNRVMKVTVTKSVES